MRPSIFDKYLKVHDPNKAHAELSASGSERWLGCPASVRLSRGIPTTDSDASIRGTNTHTLLQFILENEQWEKILDSFEAARFRNAIDYDGKMLTNALFAAGYVWRMKDELETLSQQRVELHTEKKLELRDVGFGTSDVILYQPHGELHVMDYKNGTKAVEPENNTQGLYYAVAAADLFNWEFTVVNITIIQPNAPHSRGHIRTWTVDQSQLLRAERMLVNGAKATRSQKAPMVKNDSWCWFCPARRTCPAHQELRFEKAKELFK